MEQQELLTLVKNKANQWLNAGIDEPSKAAIRHMLDNDEKELIECFYKDLEFGTGGLRGIMGTGSNRVNVYTIGMATQGLSNYLKKQFGKLNKISVVVAHDCRNNSRLFAKTTANVFSSNGFRVYLFDELKPTPELSFAIRHLGCQAGVMVTASHNPKEYNGYKAYWDDGGQIIAPHDKNIISEVRSINSFASIDFAGKKENIHAIGSEIDEVYTNQIKTLLLSPELVAQHPLRIVFTPIHGTGVKLIPMALRKAGFTDIVNVPEQDEVSGDFPTVKSPNPEENAALKMAIERAMQTGADMVMGTDPDADRVGFVVRDNQGEFIILNGNQAAALLINYLLTRWSEKGKLTGNEYIVKTIVTTALLNDIARKFGVESYDVLTGFKYIAAVIKQFEGRKTFIGGGEESYGYLAGEFVRDKDAVIACVLMAEAAAWSKSKDMTLYQQLLDIYREHGIYKEGLISVERKGKEGADEIRQMMKNFRENPPSLINGFNVTAVLDYLNVKSLAEINRRNGEVAIPREDVLQFITADGSLISVRPSGTEPKIKFYFGVKAPLNSPSDLDVVTNQLTDRIEGIIHDLKLR